jgi:hypothetical protein
MTTISIEQENTEAGEKAYRAMAGQRRSVGRTVGEALDALLPQLNEDETGTFVIVNNWRPDRFFTAAQQKRLSELMASWREARDKQTSLPPQEQAELEALADAELQAATERARAMLQALPE